MNREWQYVTQPATRQDPRGAQIDFHLTDAERDEAQRRQFDLEVNRNEPQKRRRYA